jgi:hypothetical protein
MSFQRFLLSCLMTGFVLAPLLQAQESQWQNLDQIKAGTKVEVVEQSLRSTSGRFVRVSETDLTVLDLQRREVVLPRDQVYRVTVSGKNRKRNTLIGLAAGAAGGVAWAIAMRNTENWSGGDSAGLIGGCAGIGAGIGANLPVTKTVYRAEVRNKKASEKEQSHRPEVDY